MDTRTKQLIDGLIFPECPRWHDGKVWFSDMRGLKVMTVDPDGNTNLVVEAPSQPGGLGFLPDGRLLIVSMVDRRLLRLDRDGLTEVADLSPHAVCKCNDMVVDEKGRAYIGHFGFDPFATDPVFAPASVLMVPPDGAVRVVAEDMAFPNGSAITADGRTLIVAEYRGMRLTAFDIAPNGSLSNRRVWAEMGEDVMPDGICLDTENAVWIASPKTNEVIRVHEGGNVSRLIKMKTKPLACVLGGPDRRTLFVCTTEAIGDESVTLVSGRIETAQVDVPGAGIP